MNTEQLTNRHPEMKGNWEHLQRFYELLETPRSSEERRTALNEWSSYNTTRDDTAKGPQGLIVKGAYTETFRKVDLRGLKMEYQIVGPIDLRGADLRGVKFHKLVFTKAKFAGADLRGAVFNDCWLRGAELSGAQLQGAKFDESFLGDSDLRAVQCDHQTSFKRADLQGANLSQAVLAGATFAGANLQLAQMVETDLRGADLSDCQVFGIAAWSPRVDEHTRQEHLLVTPYQSPVHIGRGRRQNVVDISQPVPPLYTDSLEHAHLIHLMSNPDLSVMLESVTKKGVLLLGRFSGEHGKVLDALRIELRGLGYLPLKFDFAKPKDRTLKETVLTLAGFCRFVVADLTEASSIPLELVTIVKEYKIPIVPIQRSGHRTFSMFESIDQEFRDRVLPALEYEDLPSLVKVVENAVVKRALERSAELDQTKQSVSRVVSTDDFE